AALPFLIRDFTPRENRVYPSGKPTTTRFRGVGMVVIGVRNLEESIALYRKAFGLPEPRRQHDAGFGAELACFEQPRFSLAEPFPQNWALARRIARFGEAPCAFVLTAAEAPGAATTKWFGHGIVWATIPGYDWRVGWWRPE